MWASSRDVRAQALVRVRAQPRLDTLDPVLVPYGGPRAGDETVDELFPIFE